MTRLRILKIYRLWLSGTKKSTKLTNAILTQVKERGLKQKEAAQMIGISATTFSDLLHGRRSMSFDIARSLYKVLGVPAEIVLA